MANLPSGTAAGPAVSPYPQKSVSDQPSVLRVGWMGASLRPLRSPRATGAPVHLESRYDALGLAAQGAKLEGKTKLALMSARLRNAIVRLNSVKRVWSEPLIQPPG